MNFSETPSGAPETTKKPESPTELIEQARLDLKDLKEEMDHRSEGEKKL